MCLDLKHCNKSSHMLNAINLMSSVQRSSSSYRKDRILEVSDCLAGALLCLLRLIKGLSYEILYLPLNNVESYW